MSKFKRELHINPITLKFLQHAGFTEYTVNSKLSKQQLMKLVWKYAKSNNLQNPQNKKEILMDSHLQDLYQVSGSGHKLLKFTEVGPKMKHLFIPNQQEKNEIHLESLKNSRHTTKEKYDRLSDDLDRIDREIYELENKMKLN